MNASTQTSRTVRQKPPEPDFEGHPVLFFDGVCGLCSHAVDFIMRRDRRGGFRFAPLQGETAQATLSPEEIANLNTMVLVTPQGRYRRSAAAVRVLWQLGGVWRILGSLLWLIPLPIRDAGYSLVASLRYRLFGKKETCRMPTPEEQGRILP